MNIPIAKLIAGYGFERAKPQDRRPATIRLYLRLLFTHLAPHFESENPADMGSLDQVYQDAWEDFVHSSGGASAASQKRFAMLISTFHNFLVKTHDFIELQDFHPFVAGYRAPENQIISLDELYTYSCDIIKSSALIHSQRLQALRLVNLGTAALRHSEAYHLQPGEVDSEGINIRTNPFRGGKTPNAIRRVVDNVMPGQHSHRLRAMAKQRQDHDSLFHPIGDNFRDEDELFSLLIDTLKSACNDNGLRFHTLRHTGITWLIVAFLCLGSKALAEFYRAVNVLSSIFTMSPGFVGCCMDPAPFVGAICIRMPCCLVMAQRGRPH